MREIGRKRRLSVERWAPSSSAIGASWRAVQRPSGRPSFTAGPRSGRADQPIMASLVAKRGIATLRSITSPATAFAARVLRLGRMFGARKAAGVDDTAAAPGAIQQEPERGDLQENFKVTPSCRRAIAALCKGYGMTKAELLEHMLARELAAARKEKDQVRAGSAFLGRVWDRGR